MHGAHATQELAKAREYDSWHVCSWRSIVWLGQRAFSACSTLILIQRWPLFPRDVVILWGCVWHFYSADRKRRWGALDDA